ncbi:UNVERIFIED_CONTAM: hypothetical protein Slati_2498200 [Sesamum latifolium]|uniref:Uncharacterized protein n=1 Tax=Sesamum latifolium TaxID=2727402 RepID=A0AAW2WES7_9LAMI
MNPNPHSHLISRSLFQLPASTISTEPLPPTSTTLRHPSPESVAHGFHSATSHVPFSQSTAIALQPLLRRPHPRPLLRLVLPPSPLLFPPASYCLHPPLPLTPLFLRKKAKVGESSSSQSRSRSSRATTVLPLAPDALGGNLQFHSRATRERYNAIRARKIIPSKNARCTQVSLIGTGIFFISLTDFNIALGFTTPTLAQHHNYLTSVCNYRDEFKPNELWRHYSVDPECYYPSRSKAMYLKEPVLKFAHRFLAFNFSGRRDNSGICIKAELFFLWCMRRGIKVNLGYWLATQMQSTLTKKRPLILGPYITLIAINLGILDLMSHNLHIACPLEPLDMACLTRTGLFIARGGTFEFAPAGTFHDRVASSSRHLDTSDEDSPSGSEEEEDDHAPHTSRDQVTLNDIARRIKRIEGNLMELFEHYGVTPRHSPTP